MPASVHVRTHTSWSSRERNWVTASMGIPVVLGVTLRMEGGRESFHPSAWEGGVSEGLSSPAEDFPPLHLCLLFCSLWFLSESGLGIHPSAIILRPLDFTEQWRLSYHILAGLCDGQRRQLVDGKHLAGYLAGNQGSVGWNDQSFILYLLPLFSLTYWVSCVICLIANVYMC